MDEIYNHISSDPEKKYLAIQNRLVLGCFDTQLEAEARCSEEIQKDRVKLLLKHRLLKKLLKKHNGYMTDYYLVCEVKNYEIPKLF